MLRRIVRIDRMFQIERGCCGTKFQRRHILFDAGLQAVDLFGRLACTQHHDTGCQGVECAGMPHFEFFGTQRATQNAPHPIHHIERSPMQRFIEVQNPAFGKSGKLVVHITTAYK